MLKVFRILIAVGAIAIVAASQTLFFHTEQQIKSMGDVIPQAEIRYKAWIKEHNCAEDPLPCEVYKDDFKSWIADFEKSKILKEQTPKFQAYQFLKDADAQYAGDFNYEGRTALTAGNLILLILSFLIVVVTKPGAHIEFVNTKAPRSTRSTSSATSKQPELKPYSPSKSAPQEKLAVPALIKKATECAESSPMQAISYLEQSMEGIKSIQGISDKLLAPVLLLCGSLRIKNKIGESQGKGQLQKVIGASPQSSEAKDAQKVLDAFK